MTGKRQHCMWVCEGPPSETLHTLSRPLNLFISTFLRCIKHINASEISLAEFSVYLYDRENVDKIQPLDLMGFQAMRTLHLW